MHDNSQARWPNLGRERDFIARTGSSFRAAFLTCVLTLLLSCSCSVFTGQADARRVPDQRSRKDSMMDNDMNDDMNIDDMTRDDMNRDDVDSAPKVSGSAVRKGLTIGLAAGLLG